MSSAFEELWARLPHADVQQEQLDEAHAAWERQTERIHAAQRREFLEIMAAHKGKADKRYLRSRTAYSHKRIVKIANALVHLGLATRQELPQYSTVLYRITPEGRVELERMRGEDDGQIAGDR